MEQLGKHGRRREEIQGPEGGPVDTATIHRHGVRVGKGGHPAREAVVDRRCHQVHFQRARPAENRPKRQLRQCPFRVEWLRAAESVGNDVEGRRYAEHLESQVPRLQRREERDQLLPEGQ